MNTRIQDIGQKTCSCLTGLLKQKLAFAIAFSLISLSNLYAQVGISTTSITPNSSSILELRSTTLGFLPPRMTTTERDAISSPATGLVIYNTTTNLLNFYNGSSWQISASGSVSSVSVTTANGVSGTVANATTTPAITLTLGAITPSSVAATGTVTGSNLSGTNTGDVTLSGQDYLSITGQAITANAIDLSGTNVTGTLAAARFGALTGDVTNTAGSYATTISNGTVTFGKMQNISAPNKILGRYSAGAGSPQELTISTGLSLDASGNLTATGGSGTVTSVSVASANGFGGTVATATTTPDITISTSVTGMLKGNGTAISAAVAGTDYQVPITTGDVTTSGATTTIANSAVTLAKMANMATSSLIYRKTAGSGAPEVNTLATLKTDLGLTGTNSGDQTITLTGDVTGSGTGSFATTIAANAVSNAELAQMASNTIKGNNTGSTANVSDLTVAQVNAILPVFTTALNGLVPASGGGTDNFLRADGSFQFPTAGLTARTTVSGAINTTETILTSFVVPANFMLAGTTFRITVYGTCTSTAANASNIRVRLGTAGTSADAIVAVVTPTAATSGTNNPFTATLMVTIRTTGTSGTAGGGGSLSNNGVTGISSTTNVVTAPTSGVAVNTTVSNTIQVSYVSAATTTTSTFQIAEIEVANK